MSTLETNNSKHTKTIMIETICSLESQHFDAHVAGFRATLKCMVMWWSIRDVTDHNFYKRRTFRRYVAQSVGQCGLYRRVRVPSGLEFRDSPAH